MLAAEYMILDNINKNKSIDDDILFFYNYDVYDSNKWDAKDWANKYNNVTDANFKFITNTKALGTSYNSNYYQYPDNSVISDLLSYYNNESENFTFDLWIVDGGLEDFWNNSINSNGINYEFIKHINKIYIYIYYLMVIIKLTILLIMLYKDMKYLIIFN